LFDLITIGFGGVFGMIIKPMKNNKNPTINKLTPRLSTKEKDKKKVNNPINIKIEPNIKSIISFLKC
jgi:hypothetical protein